MERPKRLEVYHRARNHRGRYLVLYGGAGSGKSRETANILVDRCLTGKRRVLALRKIGRTIRTSVFQQMLDVLASIDYLPRASVNKTLHEINFPNGSQIVCSGLDDPEKIKSFAGVTEIWMEEASEFSYEDFVQLDLRLRGKEAEGGLIVLTFNPISHRLWIKEHFVDRTVEGAYVLRTTYRDNPLVGDYGSVLDRITDPLLRQIYMEGEWGEDVRGLIYPEWHPIPAMPEKGARVFGLDFGFNDPMTLIEVRVYDQAELYVREWYYETGQTTGDFIAWLEEKEFPRSEIIVADPAEPDRITEIRRAGYNIVPAKKGQGSVNAGISQVKSLKMYVTEDSPSVRRELYTYKWAESRLGEIMDKPIDAYNHAMDALRYGVTQLGEGRVFNINRAMVHI